MTQPKPDEYNSHSFIAFAESYGRAAHRVKEAGRMKPHNQPVGHLACHCIELSLKAVLLAGGASANEIKSHGHSLASLFKATGMDWSDIASDRIAYYHDAVMSTFLRYRSSYVVFQIDEDDVLDLAETVFQRCLQRVLPGAKRTFRG